ncbi:MAG: thioesterase family protein [Kiritimatiellia bacterium]|jgi:acyl-CoA thioester hydrolase|nr:thioesterase family protein [Kiritimatiellia bacterium]
MFSKIITPRFGDVDGLRHINNTRLPMWFELGREPLFRFFNPEMELEHWNLIMAHIDVDFLAPMQLGADIEIRTRVAEIGQSSFTVHQEAWQNGELSAQGHAVVVHYNFIQRTPLPIPAPIREQLKEHLA